MSLSSKPSEKENLFARAADCLTDNLKSVVCGVIVKISLAISACVPSSTAQSQNDAGNLKDLSADHSSFDAADDDEQDDAPPDKPISPCYPEELPEITEPLFERVTDLRGLGDFENRYNNLEGGAGGPGAAFADLDSDNHTDLIVADFNGVARFHNDGAGNFSRVSPNLPSPERPLGILPVDIDNDGDQDVVITGDSDVVLAENLGNNEFRDATQEKGLFGTGRHHSAAACDLDSNGYNDIVVATLEPNGRYLIFLNSGKARMIENAAQLLNSKPGEIGGLAFTVFCAHLNNDNLVDLYFGRDSGSTFPDVVYVNNGDGTFRQESLGLTFSEDQGGHSGDTMGVALGDCRNTGTGCVITTTYPCEGIDPFIFEAQYSRRGTEYRDIASEMGIREDSGIGWGVSFVDIFNRGFLDIARASERVQAKGYCKTADPTRPSNRLFLYRGAAGYQPYVSFKSGDGFDDMKWRNHFGLIKGDTDGDGRVDLLYVGKNAPLDLLGNRAVNGLGEYIRLKLECVASNRDCIGARVKMVPETGCPQLQQVIRGTSLGSSDEPVLHFGLRAPAAAFEITWPSGRTQSFPSTRFPKGMVHTVVEE